jgi:hypothetical protein
MKFKQFISTINEGIITPENLKISTSDVSVLNKLYNKNDIYFTQTDGSKSASFGNFDPSGRIEIQVPKNADLNVLNSVVSHELLHREQNKKSNGNYGEWISKYGAKLNTYIKNFNNRVDNETSTQNEFDKIKQMQNVFHYNNPYELMAYAYQFVKTRHEFGFKSPNDVIKFLENTNIPKTNKIKKYIIKYWDIKEKL